METGRVTRAVEEITPGTVIYAKPGNLIVDEALTTQSLGAQRRDKHPLLVLSVNHPEQKITVTYIASFDSAAKLKDVRLKGGDAARSFFVPVGPATKEYSQVPIQWAANPDLSACWVSIRSKMELTGSTVCMVQLIQTCHDHSLTFAFLYSSIFLTLGNTSAQTQQLMSTLSLMKH